ncbi:MAG: porin [Aquabacterium sp.]|nr:porin [Aquabacterium sp.]
MVSKKYIYRTLMAAFFCAFMPAAQAQSNMTLYGALNVEFGSYQISGTAIGTDNKHLTKVDSNSMVTSYIGFKGTESLGDGLSAGFVLESFLRPDTGAAGRNDAGGIKTADVFWGRASNVWLQGGFGKLTLGRQANLLFGQVVAFNPFGGAFGLSPAVRLTYGKWGNDRGDSSWSNAASYSTPTMAGFTATAQAQAGEATNGSEGASYALGGTYVSGPLALAAGWQTVRSASEPMPNLTAGQRQTFGLLNASYDAGFAKLFAEWGQIKNHGYSTGTRINTTLFQLGAAVPVTKASKVLISYGESTEKPTEGSTSTVVTRHNILTLAYDYWLSKRTDTYAAVMMDNEMLTGFKKGYTYVVGMRHAF